MCTGWGTLVSLMIGGFWACAEHARRSYRAAINCQGSDKQLARDGWLRILRPAARFESPIAWRGASMATVPAQRRSAACAYLSACVIRTGNELPTSRRFARSLCRFGVIDQACQAETLKGFQKWPEPEDWRRNLINRALCKEGVLFFRELSSRS